MQRLATIGKMAAFISHEIKNSLVTIGGTARLVKRSLENMPLQEKRLDAIAEEVGKLEELVSNVLSFARHPRARIEPHDINEIVSSAFDAVAVQARGEIRFEKVLQEGLPAVAVDPSLMRQVFVNLLRNSMEAITGRGYVRVRTIAIERDIEVIVADTGRGMPPEVLESLFDRYYTTKEAGTGLGLAITREIIEAHGGSILCCSAEGEGSEFHIRLPVSPGGEGAQGE